MPTFTKELVKSYRDSMLKEMEEVARKYGVDIDFGNIRYRSDEFRVQMIAKDPVAKKGEEIITSRNIPGNAKIKVGSYIAHPARKNCLRVIEITARGSVIVTSDRGARYRLKMDEALKYAV